MTDWVNAGTVGEVKRRKVVLPLGEERSVLVLHHDGEFIAFDNVCVHRQKLLERGVVLNGRLVCPGHQWAFDLETGWEAKMQRCQPMYDVRVEGDTVQVDLDSGRLRVDEGDPDCQSGG